MLNELALSTFVTLSPMVAPLDIEESYAPRKPPSTDVRVVTIPGSDPIQSTLLRPNQLVLEPMFAVTPDEWVRLKDVAEASAIDCQPAVEAAIDHMTQNLIGADLCLTSQEDQRLLIETLKLDLDTKLSTIEELKSDRDGLMVVATVASGVALAATLTAIYTYTKSNTP